MTLVFQQGERQLHTVPVDPSQRLAPSHPRPTRVVVGRHTYTAHSAHELLELDTESSLARPGRPV